jgi:hypothetical protein
MYSDLYSFVYRSTALMTESACFNFDANYFDAPFTNELAPVSEKDQRIKHVIVFIRKCAKGYMVCSDDHKHFLFTRSKAGINLLNAVEAYVYGRAETAMLTYTLSAKGMPKYNAEPCTDGRYWIEDINSFAFMDMGWNGRTISEAGNPFLVPGAKGDTAKSLYADEKPEKTGKSTNKRSASDA